MEKILCESCKQEIPQTEPFVQFKCPVCGKVIARCEKCRTFGHTYTCDCGFQGP